MAFQLRDFGSIAAGMISHARGTQDKLTDFNVGSVARTILEAPSIEIEELYQRIFFGIMEAIPVAIYTGFGFPLLDAAGARGVVTVTFGVPLEEAVTIPAGSVFEAGATGIRYISTGSVTAPIGSTSCLVTVVCAEVGTVGNAPAGAIDKLVSLALPVGATVSGGEISSGQEPETEDERMARFGAYILSLARGTVDAVRYAASSSVITDETGAVVEYVSRVGIIEGGGHVRVYIYGSDGHASQDLIALAQMRIDGYTTDGGEVVPGYRAAGVAVDVLQSTEVPVNVGMLVRTMPGVSGSADLSSAIRTAVSAAIRGTLSGETLYADSLVSAALGVAGVHRVIIASDTNIICGPSEVLKLGTFVVTWDA